MKKRKKPKQRAKRKGINWCGLNSHELNGATCYCDYHSFERWKLRDV